MKARRFSFYLGLILIGIIGLSFIPLTNAATDSFQAKEKELQQVQEAQSRAESLLQDLAQDESKVMAELRQLEEELALIQKQLAALEQDLQRTEQTSTEIKKNIAIISSRQAQREKELRAIMVRYNERLRQIYMSGGIDLLDLLLETGDPGELAVRLRLFSALLEQDVALYNEAMEKKVALEEERGRLQRQQARLSQEEKRLAVLRQSTEQHYREVEQAKSQRDGQLAQILAQQASQKQALAEYQETAAKITVWLAQRRTPPLPTDQTGKVRMLQPTSGKITDEFGWRIHPIDQVNRFHEGIDIAAPEGTPIKAAAGGRVVLAGWVGGYGYTVIIEHADNLSTLYAHASLLLVQVGEIVNSGQTIAAVGNTGLSTGPHLHFEVRRSGQAINPREYVNFGA